MSKQILFGMALLTMILTGNRTGISNDSDVDVENDKLVVETDDSHDIVVFRVNPEDSTEFELLIFQFDAPVNPFSFASEQAIEDAADDFRNEYYDIDDLDSIDIRTFGGDDWIFNLSDLSSFIVAGDGDDQVNGGSNVDVIYGDGINVYGPESGEDQLDGNAGMDIIRGGPEDDEIFGGTSNDSLYGNGGNDILWGNSGDDDLYGGSGDDDLYGGADDDDLFGSSGEDDMDGGSGHDDLYGGSNDDILFGGPGDDNLFGSYGDDELYGEEGIDLLYGEQDNDYLEGGFNGEPDGLEGGPGADEFMSSQYEIRTNTYYVARTYYYPRIVYNGWIPQIVYEAVTVWVPYSYDYQYFLEIDSVVDFDPSEGDELLSEESN